LYILFAEGEAARNPQASRFRGLSIPPLSFAASQAVLVLTTVHGDTLLSLAHHKVKRASFDSNEPLAYPRSIHVQQMESLTCSSAAYKAKHYLPFRSWSLLAVLACPPVPEDDNPTTWPWANLVQHYAVMLHFPFMKATGWLS
jgi:hypothetical protein